MILDASATALLVAVAAVAVLASSAALVLAAVAARRARGATAASAQELAELRDEVRGLRAALAARPAAHPAPPEEYVITSVGDPAAADEPPAEAVTGERIDGRLFADLVLREGVVQAAALAHGVRRALAPEQRDLVRGAVRREVRRARRQRRADLRADLREVRRARAAGGRAAARHPLLGDVQEGAA